MKKLSPEEALAKVEAFHKAAGAVVEPAAKKEDAEPKGIGADSFTMPVAKAVEAVAAVEVVEEVAEVALAPEAAAKSKKKEEK